MTWDLLHIVSLVLFVVGALVLLVGALDRRRTWPVASFYAAVACTILGFLGLLLL